MTLTGKTVAVATVLASQFRPGLRPIPPGHLIDVASPGAEA